MTNHFTGLDNFYQENKVREMIVAIDANNAVARRYPQRSTR